MEDTFDPRVLDWYRQFSRETLEINSDPNLFVPVREEEIQKFEEEFGRILPTPYLAFLRQIGWGRLTGDINGQDTLDYENCFLDPASIAEIMRRTSIEWQIYPDFIREDEVPFFSLGNNSVLVFRRGAGTSVYFPYLEQRFAASFGDFISRLRRDCMFYRQLL